jgi:hypothetical protein
MEKGEQVRLHFHKKRFLELIRKPESETKASESTEHEQVFFRKRVASREKIPSGSSLRERALGVIK